MGRSPSLRLGGGALGNRFRETCRTCFLQGGFLEGTASFRAKKVGFGGFAPSQLLMYMGWISQ
eukprot:6679997-Heterocapsa_arctica.AAC.1